MRLLSMNILVTIVICLVAAFSPISGSADPVTADMALSVVDTRLNARRLQMESSAPTGKSVFALQREKISCIQQFKDPETGTLLGYVVNTEPEGFFIISADTSLVPVIARSDTGHLSLAEEEVKSPLIWMACSDLRNRIRSIPLLSEEAILKNREMWSEYLSHDPALLQKLAEWSDDYLLETEWHQGSPYNEYCPLDPVSNEPCLVGCMATALAQIIYYHGSLLGIPSSIVFDDSDSYLSILDRCVDEQRVIWIDAADTPPSIYDIDYDDELEAAKSLSYACGVALKLRYSSEGSGHYPTDPPVVVSALSRVGYSAVERSQTTPETWSRVRANILDGLPVYLSMGTDPSDECKGHALIADGYNSSTGEYHLNFGWPDPPHDVWYNLPAGELPQGFDVVTGVVLDIVPSGFGYVSVSHGLDVSEPVIIGEDFSIDFMLKETSGGPKNFESIALAILDEGGNFLFDFKVWDDISFIANETKEFHATSYLDKSRPPGTYKAVVRGKVPGGDWFDFDTTLDGVNPRSFTATATPVNSWVSVSRGVAVSPTTVTLGEDFTVSFTLKERYGTAKTFEKIAVAILYADGTHVFDFAVWDDVTIPGFGTWSQAASNYLYDSRPEGMYKAVLRGKLPGGDWFDFDTIYPAENPKSFLATKEGGGELPDLIVRDVYLAEHKTAFYPGENFTIYTRVKNIGNSDVQQDIRIEYYLSNGKKIDSDPHYIGHDDIEYQDLTAGHSGYEDYHTEAPYYLGTYNITVAADTEDVVAEQHESNNRYDPPLVFRVISPDRQTLIDLYYAWDGPNWFNNTNWLSETPINEWYGVDVDENGRVSRLMLGNNNLTGNIPESIGNLTGLNCLMLSWNQLSGQIPDAIGKLVNLSKLYLEVNQLTGEMPQSMANLTNLTELCLWVNQLTGQIPEWIGNLINLTALDLGSNQFSGEIPESIGNLSKLGSLIMSENSLSGEIPDPISNLTNLTHLWLNGNQLTGEIPDWIGNLLNLNDLILSSNQLTGEIPESIGNLVNLSLLDVRNNQLTGEIPESIGNLINLTCLDLCLNRLSGT